MDTLQVGGKRPVASFQSGNMLQRSVESRYWIGQLGNCTACGAKFSVHLLCVAPSCCELPRVAASCYHAARNVIASRNASHRTLHLKVLANNV